MSPFIKRVHLSLKKKVEIIEESKQLGLTLIKASQNYGTVLEFLEFQNETMIVKL